MTNDFVAALADAARDALIYDERDRLMAKGSGFGARAKRNLAEADDYAVLGRALASLCEDDLKRMTLKALAATA